MHSSQPSPEVLRRRLGANLRRRRLRLKLSQDELASRAGLDARHVQKLELGQVNATLKTIAALAGAVGLDPSILLRDPAGGRRAMHQARMPS